MSITKGGVVLKYFIVDHDGKYTKDFDAVFATEGAEIPRVGPKAPNLNADAERFAQTLRQELPDHFVVFGEKHLRFLLAEFLTHYAQERPHQGIGNVLLAGEPPLLLPIPSGLVRCNKRSGGLLRHYHCAAA